MWSSSGTVYKDTIVAHRGHHQGAVEMFVLHFQGGGGRNLLICLYIQATSFTDAMPACTSIFPSCKLLLLPLLLDNDSWTLVSWVRGEG